MKKTICWSLLLVLLLVCQFPAAFGEESYVIKFGYNSPQLTAADNYETAYANAFKEYVEKESDGKIKVEIYPAGQLGNFQAEVEGLMMGNIQAAAIDSAGITGAYKEATVLMMPGVFASIEEANGVAEGPWGKKLNQSISNKLNIRVLDNFCKGFRHFTNNVRELKTPNDAKGLKFRVMESPVPIKMVQALGATATPIPSAEMYSALQQGVVDGQENPITSIIQDRTYEVQKYLTLDGHTASFAMFLMSDKFFNHLPNDLQKVVLKAAGKGRIAAKNVVSQKEQNGLAFLKTKLKVYVPSAKEAAKWRQKVSGSTQQYVCSLVGKGPVNNLLTAVKKYRQTKMK